MLTAGRLVTRGSCHWTPRSSRPTLTDIGTELSYPWASACPMLSTRVNDPQLISYSRLVRYRREIGSPETNRLNRASGDVLGFRVRAWARMSINASTQIVSPRATTRLAVSSRSRQIYSHTRASASGSACRQGMLAPRPIFPIRDSRDATSLRTPPMIEHKNKEFLFPPWHAHPLSPSTPSSQATHQSKVGAKPHRLQHRKQASPVT